MRVDTLDFGITRGNMSETITAAEPEPAFRWTWRWWVLCALAVVVLAAGAAAVATAFSINAGAPRAAVRAYLGALEHGHASKALAIDGVKVSGEDLLLTDAAYKNASHRISAFTLAAPVVSGDTASVTASITQGSHHYRQAFTLERTGRLFFAIDTWKLRPVALTTVAMHFQGPEGLGFTIVGRDFDSAADVRFRALPGTYNVAQAGGSSPDVFAAPFTVTAVGFGSASPKPADVPVELSWWGDKAARTAVDAYLDACAASTELAPPGCPFHTFTAAGVTVEGGHWTIGTRPTVQTGPWTGRGWAVVSTTLGTAKMSGTGHDAAGDTGAISTSDIPFGIVGTVTFSGDKATYSPLIK